MSQKQVLIQNPGNQLASRNTRDITIRDGTTSEPQNIELSFEGDVFQFKNVNGKLGVSLRQIGEYYGVPFKQANRKLCENSEFFRDIEFHPSENISGAASAPTYLINESGEHDLYLSFRDASSFLLLLNHKRYSDERREKIIRMRNWLTDLGEKVITNEFVQKNEFLDTGRLSDNRIEVAHDAGLRKAIFHKVCRQQHPTSPNSVRRYHEVCRNDQRVIRGFDVELIPRYTKALTKEQTVKDHAQKLISTCAIICGNTSTDRINAFVYDALKGLPEKYIPDHLPQQLETTKQMNLLEAAV